MPKHGEYVPARGFWSALAGRFSQEPIVVDQADLNGRQWEMDRWADARKFKRDETMDTLIRYRDSNRVDDRAKFDKIITPQMRMSLSSYEGEVAAAEERGEL